MDNGSGNTQGTHNDYPAAGLMTFGESVLEFYQSLKIPANLPSGIEALFPFRNRETRNVLEQFFEKFYNDSNPRTLLMGINPGRFGAGITGVGFTDPIRLDEQCGIRNPFEKKAELSSKFIYDVIIAYGGPQKFYSDFFISSVCPIGFMREGKNYNYYDDPVLETAVHPFVVDCMKKKLGFGCNSKVAYSVGQGKNVKFLEKLNQKHGFFDEIKALPHPRWVMQYRLKRKDEFVKVYLESLS
ncbi:MAG: DUF4918 family protein [Cyclobacteriaceae bacterium]